MSEKAKKPPREIVPITLDHLVIWERMHSGSAPQYLAHFVVNGEILPLYFTGGRTPDIYTAAQKWLDDEEAKLARQDAAAAARIAAAKAKRALAEAGSP